MLSHHLGQCFPKVARVADHFNRVADQLPHFARYRIWSLYIGQRPTPDLSFFAYVRLFWGGISGIKWSYLIQTPSVLAIWLQKPLFLSKKIFQPPWARDIDFRDQILWKQNSKSASMKEQALALMTTWPYKEKAKIWWNNGTLYEQYPHTHGKHIWKLPCKTEPGAHY